MLLGLVPFVADPLLGLSVKAFDTIAVGAFAGSLFGVLALVAVPVLMLGAVSPWAIRLKVHRVEDSGETAGRLYAISTVGSLVGTFLAALRADPARRDAAHVPVLRVRPDGRRRARPRPPLRRRAGAMAGLLALPVGS